jgi:hypothetical protein
MKILHIELFQWLLNNHERADYVLAFSKMKGLSKREYDELVRYDPGPNLDLGRGDHYGADEFKDVLAKMYDCGLTTSSPLQGVPRPIFSYFCPP